MEEIKDNIYDAYYFKKGEKFGEKVRERIHWVTQHVTGASILDVGCSQGITPILLGREGKRVLGIDASTSAIEDAEKNLKKEEAETQGFVAFERANFFLKEFNETYDTVILGEILEHVTDLETFFQKAVSLVNEGGRLIVTSPFGINDFADHKRTFYLMDFLELKGESLQLEEVKFFGKWIGVIYERRGSGESSEENSGLLREFEGAVFNLERDYLDEINDLKTQVDVYKEKAETKISEEEFLEDKTEKVHLKKELLESYSAQEELIKQLQRMQQDYENLLGKYRNLKNSKLGKLTTMYWKFRGKRKGR